MLRALMKRKEIERATARLEELRAQAAEFETRETGIAQMIEEAETDEERSAVQEEVERFEQERESTQAEIGNLEETVKGLESELEEIEAAQEAPAQEAPAQERQERTHGGRIMVRTKIFQNMDHATRSAMFEREDVKAFIGEVRSAITEKRSITGGKLLVPDVFLGLIRQNIEEYSKLYKHVNVRQIGGDGTVVVMGTIPEAIWTDCCGVLNELSLTFNDMEVGCWKVGGYFDICNALLEDSDIDLAGEIVTVLGQAIGLALDKAILFGTGSHMPQGVFTRLAQTEAPADYPATARPWVDLHTTNIKTIAASEKGVDLFAAIVADAAAAKGKYARGPKVWVMNETTYTAIVAASMSIDAGGAVVAGVNGSMPVIGGVIEVLDFVPDNVLIGGYFDNYLLAERGAVRVESSEHVHFVQDRTVMKGTARYDGAPAIAEGFVAIGINGTTPAAAGVTFAPDTANPGE